jgi:hypothetical protein
VIAATGGSSSSKPRQRNRKGKERGLPPESAGTNSIQIEPASQESRTRKRDGRKAQGKRGESELTGQDSEQPEAGSESTPATSSNKPRPRARPLNRARTQPHSTPGSSPRLQNTDELQTAVSEATAVGTMEPAHASLPTQGSEKEDSEDTQQLSRKRPNRASPELHYADKRRKSKYVFMHLRVFANKT